MPVTAKLSKEFYDKLGHAVADELVNWFNQVDATYRNDLRELNDLNFARFDAKLEQRAAQLDAKLEQRAAQLDAKIDQRVAHLEAKLEQRVAEVKAEVRTAVATLETRMAGAEARVIRWMFVFWVGTLGTVIALQRL